jgi:phage terminase small subunit
MRKLNESQRKFCQEYVNGGMISAISAYKAAGYNTNYKTANIQACKALNRPNVKREIERLLLERKSRVEVSKEWCVEQHILELNSARERKDGTTATANIIAIGRTMGIYSDNLNTADTTAKTAEIEKKLKDKADKATTVILEEYRKQTA